MMFFLYWPNLKAWYTSRSRTVTRTEASEELWKTSPGAGRLVAQAITEAESLEAAHAIFDAHDAAPNPKNTA